MNIDQLHQTLNNEHLENKLKYDELVVFLKECIASVEDRVDKQKKLAYDITSILSTNYAQSLDRSETIDKILILAGELEVDYETKTWETFSSMIRSL